MMTVAVVRLGYVGLPLAVEFGKKYRMIGFHLSQEENGAYRARTHRTAKVLRLTEWDERPLVQLLAKLAPNDVYMDVKSQGHASALRARGIDVWRL